MLDSGTFKGHLLRSLKPFEGRTKCCLARPTWIITGSNHSHVDALVAILQPRRGLVTCLPDDMADGNYTNMLVDALLYRVLALLILCNFIFIETPVSLFFVLQGKRTRT